MEYDEVDPPAVGRGQARRTAAGGCERGGDPIAWLLSVEGKALYPDGRATGPVRAEE